MQDLMKNLAHKNIFLWLAELIIPQNPDGKVHMDLITQQGVQPLDVDICGNPDGTDWLLGVGGYCKVYKAQRPDGQEVAVKVLHNADKEAKVLMAVIDHPNVVQFHEGAGLLSWNRQGASLALYIAKGLESLHARKIVHCDIKSKNVLLTKSCSSAKIADCAPELLQGYKCTDKVDIYCRSTVTALGFCYGRSSLMRNLLELSPEKRPSGEDAVLQIQQKQKQAFKQGRWLLLKYQGYLTARRTGVSPS
ncbi:hypothetical protein WJX77_012670 [Trebouxia sp. C0004]